MKSTSWVDRVQLTSGLSSDCTYSSHQGCKMLTTCIVKCEECPTWSYTDDVCHLHKVLTSKECKVLTNSIQINSNLVVFSQNECKQKSCDADYFIPARFYFHNNNVNKGTVISFQDEDGRSIKKVIVMCLNKHSVDTDLLYIEFTLTFGVKTNISTTMICNVLISCRLYKHPSTWRLFHSHILFCSFKYLDHC